MFLASVVIPAHDEEHTIRRLLAELAPLVDEIELAVVCNGCTDNTAAVVSGLVPSATVLQLDRGWKPAALNAGDACLSVMPRLYLDADVLVDPAGVRQLVAALDDQVLAVAPTPRYEVGGAARLVRSHYRIWTRLNSARDAVYGTGAIMLSAAGRMRFAEWPDLIADDLFVDSLFDVTEKCRVRDVEVIVTLPRRFRDCVSRKARTHQGNRDVLSASSGSRQGSTRSKGARLITLLRSEPRLWLDVPAHVVVTISSRLLAGWRRWRGKGRTFYRDSSSRTGWSSRSRRTLSTDAGGFPSRPTSMPEASRKRQRTGGTCGKLRCARERRARGGGRRRK